MSKGSLKLEHGIAYRYFKAMKREFQPYFSRFRAAGSIRRRNTMVGDIDIVAQLKPGQSSLAVMNHLRGLGVDPWGGYLQLNFIVRETKVNIFVCTSKHMGAMMKFATGPGGYNIGYRTKAKSMGMILSQYGLKKGNNLIADTERGIYQAFGKPWKHPSQRGR